jgi:hypothetical protein
LIDDGAGAPTALNLAKAHRAAHTKDKHLAGLTAGPYDPQLGVDDTAGDKSPVSTVSQDGPDVVDMVAEPERSSLATTFLLFDWVATTYRNHVLEKRGMELIFV